VNPSPGLKKKNDNGTTLTACHIFHLTGASNFSLNNRILWAPVLELALVLRMRSLLLHARCLC